MTKNTPPFYESGQFSTSSGGKRRNGPRQGILNSGMFNLALLFSLFTRLMNFRFPNVTISQ